jgi:hypothetical protein
VRTMFVNRSTVFRELIIAITIIAFLSISCSRTSPTSEETIEATLPPDYTDKSWLRDEPCKSPCWYGLNIGDTRKEQALSIIEGIPSLLPKQIEEHESQYWDPEDGEVKISEIISLPCKFPEKKICCQLEFVDELLMRIALFPNFPITFGEVVDWIGVPDYITARPIYPEIGNCEVRLIWINRQLMIKYFEYQESSGRDLCREISNTGHRVPIDLPVNIVYIEDAKVLESIPVPGEDFVWVGFYK